MKKKIIASLFAIIFSLSLVSDVLAIDNPDSIIINQVRAYRDVEVDGDLLVVARYDINYTTNPVETVTEAYIARFLDGATQLATTAPYAFVIPNNGYDLGLFGFYFSTEPIPATGFEVSLQGNPSLFPSSTGNKAVNSGIEFRSGSLLAVDMRLQGQALQGAWRVTDPTVNIIEGTTEGLRLTVSGEEYFTNSIPNIRATAGEIFQSNIRQPVIHEDTFTNSYANQIRDYWAGTSMDNAFVGLADYLDTPKVFLTTAVLILVASGIAFYVVAATQNGGMGVMTGVVVICIGALVGWTSFQFVALLGLLGALAIGYVIWYQKAAS